MKRVLKGIVAMCAMGVASQATPAREPKAKSETKQAKMVKLDKKALDKVVAGKITLTNNGGGTPNDNAAGRDNISYKNPAGYSPPGQN